jgi:hypothetical protein
MIARRPWMKGKILEKKWRKEDDARQMNQTKYKEKYRELKRANPKNVSTGEE